MISYRTVSQYCKDDISLIENYEAAINSPEKWDCHHRLETDLNMTQKELIDQNLYLNRPASELIFLTPSEHTRLHKKGNVSGENNPMYGKEGANKGKHPWNYNLKGVQKAWNKGLKGTQKSPIKGKHRVYRDDGSYYFA